MSVRVLATEVLHRVRRGNRKVVVVYDGERVFKVSDHLVATSLLQWSGPVQLRLQRRDDGTYDLVARTWDYRQAVVEPRGAQAEGRAPQTKPETSAPGGGGHG